MPPPINRPAGGAPSHLSPNPPPFESFNCAGHSPCSPHHNQDLHHVPRDARNFNPLRFGDGTGNYQLHPGGATTPGVHAAGLATPRVNAAGLVHTVGLATPGVHAAGATTPGLIAAAAAAPGLYAPGAATPGLHSDPPTANHVHAHGESPWQFCPHHHFSPAASGSPMRGRENSAQGAVATPTPAAPAAQTLVDTEEEKEEPVDSTPRRRTLDRATSQDFQKRNYCWSNLKEKRGVEMEKSNQSILWDEQKPKSLHGKKRKIDTDLLAESQKKHLRFLYPTDKRNLATVCNAHTEAHHKMREEWFPEESKLNHIKHAKQVLRREAMQPWKCLHAVDTCPVGGFNFSACDNLRTNVEGLEKNEQGLFPCSSSVKGCAYELEARAKLMGLEHEEVETIVGHGYKCDFATLLRHQVEKYGLDEFAATSARTGPNKKDRVLIAVTLDGALLTKELSHPTCGVKNVDPRCRDPISGKKINYQSRDECFVCCMLLGKDTKEAHNDGVVKEFLDFFSREEGEIVCPACADPMTGELKPELSNFEVVSPADMKAQWTITGLGSATGLYFCLCCSCRSDEKSLFKNVESCPDCSVSEGVTRCHCHPTNDGEHLDLIESDLNNYFATTNDNNFEDHDRIQKDSKMEYVQNAANKERRPNHIDFVPLNRNERVKHNQELVKEYKLRTQGKPKEQHDQSLVEFLMLPDLDDRQEKLKEMMTEEHIVEENRHTMNRQSFVKWFKAEQAIPCILHLVMRVAERLFWGLLKMCMLRYQSGDDEKRKAFVANVTSHMNEVALNSRTGYRNLWTMGLVETEKGSGAFTVEVRNMTGDRAKKIMHGMKGLVKVCFAEEHDQSGVSNDQRNEFREENDRYMLLWLKIMDVFLEIMVHLEKTTDFEEPDVLAFHRLTAIFMHLYCLIFQNGSIANCTHLIGSGHLTYYLRKYKNLSRFQQQGWEALNQLFKSFFFKNTNKGGAEGSGDKMSGKHLRALARLCARRNLWFFGIAQAHFKGELPPLDADEAIEAACGEEGTADSSDQVDLAAAAVGNPADMLDAAEV